MATSSWDRKALALSTPARRVALITAIRGAGTVCTDVSPNGQTPRNSHEGKLLIDPEHGSVMDVFGAFHFRVYQQHLSFDFGEEEERLEHRKKNKKNKTVVYLRNTNGTLS